MTIRDVPLTPALAKRCSLPARKVPHQTPSQDMPKFASTGPLLAAKRDTQPTQRTPRQTSPHIKPASEFASQARSPHFSSSVHGRPYSGSYPVAATATPFLNAQHSHVEPGLTVHVNLPFNVAHCQQRQITELEPDVEPGPFAEQVSHAKATSAGRTLGMPLLHDAPTLEQQSPAPTGHTTKTCLRALAVLILWAVAALLGISVTSTAQATHAMHAATAARLQTALDFTLRLARAPEKCLGVADVKMPSHVVLQACRASGAQQFLLLQDGTIRSRSDERLCITSMPGNKLALSLCSQSEMQVFNVQPTGQLVLKAKPSECLNLLQGDLKAGAVGLYRCSGDLNEVFVYGGAHFLVPVLDEELSKVRMLSPVSTNLDGMQENLRAVCWFTFSMLILSALLIMVASPKRHFRCHYVMALGFVACVVFFICYSLFSAKNAMQQSAHVTKNAKAVASGPIADFDSTLRMPKSADLCLGAGSLKDQSKVSLQQCKASAVQQFILKDDGTIRARQADGQCLTVEQESKHVVLSPCDASKSRLQIFCKHPRILGWLQLQASPSMCLNLLGGDEKAGDVGLYKCGSDLNEVFVYGGGNAAISAMALRVHKVRLLLQHSSHHLEGGFVRILDLGGVACFLLLALPSLMLLAGSAGPTSV